MGIIANLINLSSLYIFIDLIPESRTGKAAFLPQDFLQLLDLPGNTADLAIDIGDLRLEISFFQQSHYFFYHHRGAEIAKKYLEISTPDNFVNSQYLNKTDIIN